MSRTIQLSEIREARECLLKLLGRPTVPESKLIGAPSWFGDSEKVPPLVEFAIFHGDFVELIGIEPTTSGLQSQRSPN